MRVGNMTIRDLSVNKLKGKDCRKEVALFAFKYYSTRAENRVFSYSERFYIVQNKIQKVVFYSSECFEHETKSIICCKDKTAKQSKKRE